MTKPWELYLLWGVVIGSATGALAVPLAAIISTRWFSTRRGLVSGLLTASNASGQLVFLPLLAWISVNYGWRWTAGAVVIAASGLVIPLAIIFLRHSPAEIGIAPYGASEPEPPVPPLVNPFRSAIATLREFAGRRDFQLLVFAFFVCGATTNGSSARTSSRPAPTMASRRCRARACSRRSGSSTSWARSRPAG